MIETTRPELVAYQEERLAKFVKEIKVRQRPNCFCRGLHHGVFALKKYLGSEILPLVNRGIAGTDSVWL